LVYTLQFNEIQTCSLNELQALLVGAYLNRCLRFGNSNICLNELQALLVARSNSFKNSV